MREIKFRAWDKEERKMVSDFDIEATSGDPVINESQSDPRDLIVMQYTGLLDKNGKEIYEGDIVKSTAFNASEVRFKHGAFIIGYHRGSSTAVRPMLLQNNAVDKAGRLEIIGNIYQNPGLITKQK